MNTPTWRRSARLMGLGKGVGKELGKELGMGLALDLGKTIGKGLGQTTAELAAVQRRWQALLGAAGAGPSEPAARSRPDPAPAGRSRLREVRAFGANPGDLRMFAAVSSRLPRGAPLVVVLHGCTQHAAGYDRGSGWSALAEEAGFAVLFPEQQKRNNAHGCFSWFQQPDVTRGQGEVASIRDMILHMVESHGLDRRRIFITGLSAGAAMANAMLATYPELFAAGALVGGLPYGAATGLGEAFQAMTSGRTGDPERWAAHVRDAAPTPASWPRVSVWHGTADATVSPVNASETVKQWLAVHDLVGEAPVVQAEGRLRRRVWPDQTRNAIVEEVLVEDMGHGTPVDRAVPGEDGRFFLDVGVASTAIIAASWGLVPR